MSESGQTNSDWAVRARVLIVAVIVALIVAVGVMLFNAAPDLGTALIGTGIDDPRSAGRAVPADANTTEISLPSGQSAETMNAVRAPQAAPSETERVRAALRRVLADDPDTLEALEGLLDEPDPLVLAEHLAMLRTVFIEPARATTTVDNE